MQMHQAPAFWRPLRNGLNGGRGSDWSRWVAFARVVSASQPPGQVRWSRMTYEENVESRFLSRDGSRPACPLMGWSPFDKRSEQFVSISVADLFVGRHSAGRPGLDFASVGQAADSDSGRTWRTNRSVDSADPT